METPIGLYGTGNEIIFWHSLSVGLCFVLSGNHCCMCYRHQSMLCQIYMSRIDNDNVQQSLKIVFGNDNIHSSCMAREKMRNLSLYVSYTLWHDSYNDISKCVMDCNAFTSTRAT
jgi:Fe-S-cluster containining protein